MPAGIVEFPSLIWTKCSRGSRFTENFQGSRGRIGAGIDADYLGEIERGEKWPALWMIRAIARAFKVSPERFFEFENETASSSTAIEKFQRILEGRTPKEEDQAVRVIRALFGS